MAFAVSDLLAVQWARLDNLCHTLVGGALGEAGLKPKAATGGEVTRTNEPALVVVPPVAVTLIGPFVAAAGTVAVIDVVELTVKVAPTPLMRTAVMPVKFDPLIVIVVPTGPLAGVKLVIAGEACNAA